MFINWEEVNTMFAQDQVRTGLTPGIKSLVIRSADSSSLASGAIELAPWLSAPTVDVDVSDRVSLENFNSFAN
jgi:hypothetical protein